MLELSQHKYVRVLLDLWGSQQYMCHNSQQFCKEKLRVYSHMNSCQLKTKHNL